MSYQFDNADIQKNKTVAGLAYLIFFLPLIVCPDSPYGRFHANQALVLFLLNLAIGIVGGLLCLILIGFIIMPAGYIFTLVLSIMGLVAGLQGQAKVLPLIGKIRILK